MELYKDDPDYPELHDSGATIAYIRRINGVIKAMTSRTPLDALRLDQDCKNRKVIHFKLNIIINMFLFKS